MRKSQEISFIEGASTRSHSALGARVWLAKRKVAGRRGTDVNEEGSKRNADYCYSYPFCRYGIFTVVQDVVRAALTIA